MAINSDIEWTNATWNPITGCTKISPGCMNCYAERMSKRLQAMGSKNYLKGFKLSFHRESFTIPLNWKKPQIIFVNSMSDIFHKDVPDSIILELIEFMRNTNWHIYQLLTKRAERLEILSKKINWPENVWMGVSVENQDYVYRIEHLKKTNARIKFISFEPLLGPIRKINLHGIDWVIVGGESGPGARPIQEDWILDIKQKCIKTKIPFFFKQWGGVRKKETGRMLQGKIWNEWPKVNVFQ